MTPDREKSVCKVFGILEFEKAFEEALWKSKPYMAGAKWSHEVIRRAAKETGHVELRTLPKDQSRPLFRARYVEELEKFARGLYPATSPLAAKRTPEVGNAAIASIRDSLTKFPFQSFQQ